jgi:flagellar hook-associated protein 2
MGLRTLHGSGAEAFNNAGAVIEWLRENHEYLRDPAVVGGPTGDEAEFNNLTLSVNLNGTQRSVMISADRMADIAAAPPANQDALFITALNESLRTSFGADTLGVSHVQADIVNGNLTFNSREGSSLVITTSNNRAAMEILGSMGFDIAREAGTTLAGGIYVPGSVLNTSQLSNQFRPANVNMTDFLSPDQLDANGGFSFEVNGLRFVFNPNAAEPAARFGRYNAAGTFTSINLQGNDEPTVQQVLNAITNSPSGVRMQFSATTGRFTMESQQLGAQHGTIDFSGSFFARIGFAEAEAVTMTGGVVDLATGDINGVNLNDFINGGDTVDFTSPLEFTVNGQQFTFSGPTSLNDIMTAINAIPDVTMSFDTVNVRFVLENSSGRINFGYAENSPAEDFFAALGLSASDVHVDAAQNTLAGARIRDASDAVVYINQHVDSATNTLAGGTRHYFANNNFTIDGLTFRINPDQFNAVSDPVEIEITLERETSGVMQLIRDFVDEYNALIRSIRDLTETRRPRQAGGGGFYLPLTEEQRRAMSDREVELWDSQARTGLLNRDNTLRNLTQELHREIFRNVQLSTGEELNLLHIGIRTHSDLDRFGELQIDEDRLQWFLDNRLDDVSELFSNASMSSAGGTASGGERARLRRIRLNESGIGQRINDILTWQLSTGGGIHDRAGEGLVGTRPDDNNFLGRRIAQEDRRIEDMIRDLQRREHRYFAVFGRLEAAMIQANSQMMFMEQMFWMG